jgi:hypothetical protein
MTVRRQIVEKEEVYFITFTNVYDEPRLEMSMNKI